MKIWRKCFLFCLGGSLYACMELLYRGRTHYSMFLLGGALFLVLGALRRAPLSWPTLTILGAVLITAGELFTGLAVNRNFAVWDYRALPMNFLGQISLQFSLLWLPVALLAMTLYGPLEEKLPR